MQQSLHRNGLELLTFPNELLVEILGHLSWRNILVVRRTCKLLFDVSKSRAIWVSLFLRFSREGTVPPVLDRPLKRYTVAELENIVLKRISSEVRWAHSEKPHEWKFRAQYPSDEDCVLLLDGGRWLLAMFQENAKWGRVYVYDLDGKACPKIIISLGIEGRMDQFNSWHMDADRDLNNDDSSLSFTLCLTSTYRPADDLGRDSGSDRPVNGVYIYRLTVKGQGHNAVLKAHKLKHLRDSQLATDDCLVYSVALRGEYLVRYRNPPNPGSIMEQFYTFEVYNWALSNNSVHYKACVDGIHRIQLDDNPLLLRDGKLLVFSSPVVSVYDIANLEPSPIGAVDIPTLESYWQFTDFSHSHQVHFSRPYRDSLASRVSVVLDNHVFGFTIPHDIQKNPSWQQLSESIFPPDELLYCVGINKIYFFEESQLGNGKGTVKTEGLLWDKGEGDKGCFLSELPLDLPVKHLSQRQFEPPLRPWYDDVAPLFDESSNRIVTFSNKSWILLDFAYRQPQ
ncbi:hypothetical protein BDN70DRAFT_920158 [Pholiota conissans]|uniref:F-box domain-containing protein n=1 Tax=Pholiota conissans TaxID=109636 RepID=A0A9P5Z7L3_9AGAR|nr:hypothetical protein BDN70DRAFT_920158 [Pholiota conissans]